MQFPIKLKNVDIVHAAVTCMTRTCPQRWRSFWVCYDAWWAAVVASISLVSKVDFQKGPPSLSDNIRQCLHRQSQIANVIFAGGNSGSRSWGPIQTLQHILAAEPYPSCSTGDCSCFGAVQQPLHDDVGSNHVLPSSSHDIKYS